MEKGYYKWDMELSYYVKGVAIHNKNGKGLLRTFQQPTQAGRKLSQSTIKMEKGYYN